MKNNFDDFKDILLELMESKNLTVVSLARSLGIYHNLITSYLSGHTYPSVEIAVKISKFFNCSLDYLFCLSKNKDVPKVSALSFYETYNALLKKENKSNYAFCKINDIDIKGIYRWRVGKIPTIETLKRMCVGFNCTLDFLVGDLHWKHHIKEI